MNQFTTSGILVLVIGFIYVASQIFINEKKIPQDSTEHNELMNFLMRSVFLLLDSATHVIFWFMIIGTG